MDNNEFEQRTNNNYSRFPNNFYFPEIVTVDEREYVEYFVRFNNLYEIHDFIKSRPTINRDTFQELSSETGDYDFAGMPFKKAVEDLINFDEDSYMDFLDLIKELANVKAGYKHEYKEIKTLAGGHLNTVDYSRGTPLCYETYERIKRPKFINIYSTLSYQWTTNKNQVLNRAIILVSIINALEKNGYNINLTAFEMSQKYREVVNILVDIKKHGEKTNLQTLYKTSCKVEFLRRILFRILECLPVHEYWNAGYGRTSDEEFVRELLNVGKNDIYFGTPQELGIRGDLEHDFNEALTRLNLKDKFDVREISDEFKENIKKLVK